MSKKIGLILSIKGVNYGMLLQSYATQLFLDRNGFETFVIALDKEKTVRSIFNRLFYIFRPLLLKTSLNKRKRRTNINKNPVLKNAYKLRKEDSEYFVKNRFHNIIRCSSIADAKKKVADFFAIVIGSDQQWTPGAFFTDFNTLMFVPKKIRRISYATSLGVSKLPYYCKKRGNRFLKKMDYVSVREESGKKIIENIVKKEVSVVLDPTFLITSCEWEKIIPIRRLEQIPYVLCYFLGDNEENMLLSLEYAHSLGLKAIFIRNIETYNGTVYEIGDKILDSVTPEEFINYIRYADAVFTDSFHGTVFSILNKKKFVTFYRTKSSDQNSRNTRIDNLLGKLDLCDRIFSIEKNITIITNKEIDYSSVFNKIDLLRQISKEFLLQSLR